jgi:hypothetical protein
VKVKNFISSLGTKAAKKTCVSSWIDLDTCVLARDSSFIISSLFILFICFFSIYFSCFCIPFLFSVTLFAS